MRASLTNSVKETRVMLRNFRRRNSLSRNILVAIAAVVVLGIAIKRSYAQKTTAAEESKGAQILLLGTHGGPVLSERQSEPATLLIVDGRQYLIDCGIGTMRRMLDAGVKSDTIGTIFITHNHPDHALGIVDVLANDFLSVDFGVGLKEFNIYGPPETPALVSAAYNYISIPYGVFAAEPLGASTLANPFKAHVVDHDGLVYKDDKIRVAAAENSHYHLMRSQYHAMMKSYSYRFETPYGAIVFTGDTGPSTAAEALAKGADVLISEVEDLEAVEEGEKSPAARPGNAPGNGDVMAEHMRKEHLSFKALGELASKAQVKALVLYHYVGGEDGARFAAGVKQYYSGPVFAGEDLARYCLGAEGTGNGSRSSALRLCP
jgi:ribonuclease BN (tRNA processing enzyme)